MIKVIITDEFLRKYVFNVESSQEASKIVNDWLMTKDETPIYEINILIEE